MKVLVCSRLSIPDLNRYLPDWMQAAFDVSFNVDDGKPDAIVLMGVGALDYAKKAVMEHPDVPLFVYNWDCYVWCILRPRPGDYDYRSYGKLIKVAKEVWVPTRCTKVMTELWWGVANVRVIHPSIAPFEAEVSDEGYVLCSLRETPDHDWPLLEIACSLEGIPLEMPNHQESREQYEQTVANCRFLVSHIREASTGGLTLLEAYRLGKPVLITNSPWNGAVELFGWRGRWFQYGDIHSLRLALRESWKQPTHVCEDHRRWVDGNYSDRLMLEKIKERINANLR